MQRRTHRQRAGCPTAWIWAMEGREWWFPAPLATISAAGRPGLVIMAKQDLAPWGVALSNWSRVRPAPRKNLRMAFFGRVRAFGGLCALSVQGRLSSTFPRSLRSGGAVSKRPPESIGRPASTNPFVTSFLRSFRRARLHTRRKFLSEKSSIREVGHGVRTFGARVGSCG